MAIDFDKLTAKMLEINNAVLEKNLKETLSGDTFGPEFLFAIRKHVIDTCLASIELYHSELLKEYPEMLKQTSKN